MPSRQTLLRIMLACLGLTALVGVLGVFAGSWDLLGRLMGTTVAGAITAAIMLAAVMRMDTSVPRRAATAVMAVAMVQFGLAFVAIWSWWLKSLMPAIPEDVLWMTALSAALTGWPAVWLIAGLSQTATRRAAWAALMADAGVLVLLLLGFWWPGRWWSGPGDRLLLMALVLAAQGAVASLCLIGWKTGDRRWWRWIGVAAATIPIGGFWWGIWARVGGQPTTLLIIGSGGVLIAHANLVLQAPLRRGQEWLRIATIAAAVFSVLFLDALLLDDSIIHMTIIGQTAIASGIVAVCGTLAIIVLVLLNRRAVTPTDDREVVLPSQVSLTCPVCRAKLAAPVGESACHGCGLRFVVRIELPRCPACQYVLLHHRGGSCPECGAATTARSESAAEWFGEPGARPPMPSPPAPRADDE